jgi:hypothetical protein
MIGLAGASGASEGTEGTRRATRLADTRDDIKIIVERGQIEGTFSDEDQCI